MSYERAQQLSASRRRADDGEPFKIGADAIDAYNRGAGSVNDKHKEKRRNGLRRRTDFRMQIRSRSDRR